jgi:anti-anti-sigma factor
MNDFPLHPPTPSSANEPCSIAVERHDKALVLKIAGYWEARAGHRIETLVLNHLTTGRPRVALDLTDCLAINSPSLGSLLDLVLKVTQDHRGLMVLVNPNPTLKRVLQMTCITPAAIEVPTMDAALLILGEGEA